MSEKIRPTELETRVMDIILKGDDPVRKILRAQWKNCEIRDREYSGTGFFLDFDVSDDFPKLKENKNLEISTDENGLDIVVNIHGVEHGIGFVLFVRDGMIHWLEGFTFAGENLPDTISDFQLERVRIPRV